MGFSRDGKSRQFAFIGFRTEREAEDAIKYFNKSYIDTCRITCEVHIAVPLSFSIFLLLNFQNRGLLILYLNIDDYHRFEVANVKFIKKSHNYLK